MKKEQPVFVAAKPVWIAGREREMNLFAGFRVVFKAAGGKPLLLRLAGASAYRIWLNGQFLANGPARAGHGCFRFDEITLTAATAARANVLAIEVAGYNVNSYSTPGQPAFLQAEIVSGVNVVAATGVRGFDAFIIPEKVQKIQRYSYQRTFAESYRLSPGYDNWRVDSSLRIKPLRCAVQPYKKLTSRNVPLPRFELRQPARLLAGGNVKKQTLPEKPWRDRSLNISPNYAGYAIDVLEQFISDEVQTFDFVRTGNAESAFDPAVPLKLAMNGWRILDMGRNLSGMIGMHVSCTKKTRLFLIFDEILTDGDVSYSRMSSINAIPFDLAPGEYNIETFEPYTFRYLKLAALNGGATVTGPYLRELACPDVWRASFSCSDDSLNELFEAGRETFRQNAVDIFMDCPSRERAGWLCDSFFMGRVEKCLCGQSVIERNFLENFLISEQFPRLPAGMLPMCYPSDHMNGTYIPNWAMWFPVQLAEYLERTGDRALVDALKPRVTGMMEFFRKYLNSDGLLEKLESWVFIEWSEANKFVQDVNYPSNMLYAYALDKTAELYAMPQLSSQAAKIRRKIVAQSFDGEFFVDNAVRRNGKLEITGNRSETCQYYAFFFGVATPEKYPALWRKLLVDFAPDAKMTPERQAIHQSNAFIGYYLRLELLSRFGEAASVARELKLLFSGMAAATGTLWENMDSSASCNHGFASHVVQALYRDVLGCEIDWTRKLVHLRQNNSPLKWCRGSIPAGKAGSITVKWHRSNGRQIFTVETPAGFAVTASTEAREPARPDSGRF